MNNLSPDQIEKLKSLGIDIDSKNNPPQNLDLRNSKLEIRPSHSPIFPLLSISGLTILSFSGLILFKNKLKDKKSREII